MQEAKRSVLLDYYLTNVLQGTLISDTLVIIVQKTAGMPFKIESTLSCTQLQQKFIDITANLW